MKNVVRCTSVLVLAALVVLPWQRVGVTVADDLAPSPVVSVAPVTMRDPVVEREPVMVPSMSPIESAPVVPVPEPVAPVGTPVMVPPVTEPPVVEAAPSVMEPSCYEDQPCWDCRTMGNMRCGVLIQGDRYIVQFVAGQPVSITPAN